MDRNDRWSVGPTAEQCGVKMTEMTGEDEQRR